MKTLLLHFSAHALSGFGAIVLYLGITAWQGRGLLRGERVPKTRLRVLSAIAIALHGHSVLDVLITPAGLNLGFFQVSSLIFWVVCVVLLISSLRLPVESLFVLHFPLSALSVFCSLHFHSGFTPEHHLSHEIGWHILLSILAYSVLTIAAIQALALTLQDKLLRERRFQGPLAALPPLQTMEALLFEMLWAGTVLLTLSLGTGFMFFDNIRAQNLVPKMAFASIAWLIYVLLLWGRTTHGLRGKQAIRWTLGGFIALMLAYFGSKFVTELILA
jgi:ABC-type uncharacterized transport system permease subunit